MTTFLNRHIYTIFAAPLTKGDSLENPIVIDAKDTVTGLTLEHGYIDQFIESLDGDVESIDQNLVIENGRSFDQAILAMDNGSERTLYFDVSSFFGKM